MVLKNIPWLVGAVAAFVALGLVYRVELWVLIAMPLGFAAMWVLGDTVRAKRAARRQAD